MITSVFPFLDSDFIAFLRGSIDKMIIVDINNPRTSMGIDNEFGKNNIFSIDIVSDGKHIVHLSLQQLKILNTHLTEVINTYESKANGESPP